ncbi:MAG: hypothetical protein WDW38_006998 [Sanguina aurantia]
MPFRAQSTSHYSGVRLPTVPSAAAVRAPVQKATGDCSSILHSIRKAKAVSHSTLGTTLQPSGPAPTASTSSPRKPSKAAAAAATPSKTALKRSRLAQDGPSTSFHEAHAPGDMPHPTLPAANQDQRPSQPAISHPTPDIMTQPPLQVERVVSTGDLDEAERELRLLHDYGKKQAMESDNYKLALLGSYLYAQRNLLSRTHETEALQIREAHAAAAPP